MSKLDKLQVLALLLELLGFGLAMLDIFNNSFAKRSNEWLSDKFLSLGFGDMDYSMPGADEDPDLSDEKRNKIVSRNLFFMLLTILVWIWLSFTFNFGDGGWWRTLEILTALIASTFVAMFIHMLTSLALMILMSAAVSSGNGNFVAGIGFFLAAIGMAIESYQIFYSTLHWALFPIWGCVIIFIVWLMVKKLTRA
ncbi:hypothetical protein [Pseudomonas sp. MN1F]|uniref:hypothetical protein n=1 Tax=Pseudomonas sp. MN1F TaxID=1366632 RepID=UPI00128F7BFF|nr:hypothetical protein [Pseudomonas sp. MN1F]MQG96535.1 hypothetical protein [Pseudomonas sp. MN1F]